MSNLWGYRAKPYKAQPYENYALLALPTSYRPLLLWAFEAQKDSNDWVTGDAPEGYEAICRLQWETIMQCGLERLEAASNRIYMLIDASLNGASYSAVSNPLEPSELIAPQLPVVPLAFNQVAAQAALAMRSLVTEERTRDIALVNRDLERQAQLEAIKAKLDQLVLANDGEKLDDILGLLASIFAVL